MLKNTHSGSFRRPAPAKAGHTAQPAATSRWHSVSIVCGQRSCEAVRALTVKRWMPLEAPRLPIASCDAKYCECKYRHHADRRAKPRRKGELDGAAPVQPKEERRYGKRGRRTTDQ